MSVQTIRSIVDAELDGKTRFSEFVKNINQVTTAGLWYDITGAAGNPRAKQWFDAAPLTAQQIKQSTDGGIYHGHAPTGQTKFLRFLRCACASATPLPMSVMLMDFLLYYPSIEDGNTDASATNKPLIL